ncbi:MAG TPA: DUF350 domain-containing protein [Patescibacteria group bacterium]|jgi:uncharacterized membrane protein YjfL (UPF0719 family)|nr:DUF350 domain-containing protein [Patescibacteria group bacterium]
MLDPATAHMMGSATVFSTLGIVMLTIAFLLLDILTPQFQLWKEIIEKQNTALAILLGAFTLGLALIISAAVHG